LNETGAGGIGSSGEGRGVGRESGGGINNNMIPLPSLPYF